MLRQPTNYRKGNSIHITRIGNPNRGQMSKNIMPGLLASITTGFDIPTQIPVQIVDTPQDRILALYAIAGSWRKLQALYYPEIPFGTLHAYGHGRPVRNPVHRVVLGARRLETVEVSACASCGKIHPQVKSCKTAKKRRRSYMKKELYFLDHKII